MEKWGRRGGGGLVSGRVAAGEQGVVWCLGDPFVWARRTLGKRDPPQVYPCTERALGGGGGLAGISKMARWFGLY